MKIISNHTTNAGTRFSAQLRGISCGTNSVRSYNANDGSYNPANIKANNNSGHYGFVVVELHSEINDRTLLQLQSTGWIFTGGNATNTGASGQVAGQWIFQGHHRATYTTNKMNAYLIRSGHQEYWTLSHPIANSRNDPLFYYNETDSKIACWFGTFDLWRSNGEASSGQQWEGDVHVSVTPDTESGGAAKEFITDIYSSYNLPGTNDNWAYWTIDDFARATAGSHG